MATIGRVEEITSEAAAHRLAQLIVQPQRTSPIVVVSVAAGSQAPYFDVDHLAQEVGFRADTYVIPDRWASPLSLRMPGGCAVFGGAARVYPARWDLTQGSARLFPAKSCEEAAPQLAAIVALVKPARREPVRVVSHTGSASAGSSSPTAQALLTDRPATGPVHLQHVDEVDALIHLLRLPTRRHPVVVITIAAGRTEPYVDSDTVVEVAPGQVHVLVLPTGPLSWRLSGALGDLAGVYGGAARVYGIDNAWVSNPYASALHFSYDRGGGARAADKLASEVLADLHRHGATSEQVRPTLQVDGAVEGLIAQTRALVRLTDGQLATVWAEITAEGCHIDQLVTPGMVMSGDLDPEWHRLDVSGMRMSAADALGHYEVGDVVLVRVDEVTHRSAVVCLLPGTTSNSQDLWMACSGDLLITS